jgi:hypothetical protein
MTIKKSEVNLLAHALTRDDRSVYETQRALLIARHGYAVFRTIQQLAFRFLIRR